MHKLITVTWSNEEQSNYVDSFLYKTFIKNNNKENFINLHFNRIPPLEQENEYKNMFGVQSEYIFYKIVKLYEYLHYLDNGIYIYADINDVVCLDNINNIDISNIGDSVLFGCESHQHPTLATINNWPVNTYLDNYFLNSGLYIGTRDNIIKLLGDCIQNILPLHFKNFGGDQGVFVFDYLNNQNTLITLDKNNKWFLSTYLKSHNNYNKINNKLYSFDTDTTPTFVHDNGWNYGSPRFIEHFNLL